MTDWSLTPFISAAQVPTQFQRVVEIPENRVYLLQEYGKLRADGGRFDRENSCIGIFGEECFCQYVGLKDGVDTAIYDDGGDGGVDLTFAGQTVDVKTASRNQRDPALLVGAYQPLRAEYYALIHRIGSRQFRLIGYCPRQFVANAPTREFNGEEVHVVPQEDLFPFPFWLGT